MISGDGNLAGGKGESEAAGYARALSLLIQGMEIHSFDSGTPAYRRFRADLAGIQHQLLPELSSPELLALVGAAIRAFADYNRITAAKLHGQFSELRAVIAAFGAAVPTMVPTGDASRMELRAIGSALSTETRIDKLRILRNRLRGCLREIAEDVERDRHAAAPAALNSVDRTKGSELPDPATGLPGRPAAEAALSRVASNGAEAVAAIFVMKRLKQMNAGFGYEVTSGLLAWLSTYLGSGTSPEEGFYRWSGPALLALISRKAPLVRIRQEIGALVTSMPQREITICSRVMTIPLAIAWTALPVTRSVEKLVARLESFVEIHSLEETYATG